MDTQTLLQEVFNREMREAPESPAGWLTCAEYHCTRAALLRLEAMEALQRKFKLDEFEQFESAMLRLQALEAAQQQAEAEQQPFVYWRDMVGVYQEYCRCNSIPFKFTAASGRALKEIVTQLLALCEGDERKVLGAWTLVFQRWQYLPPFFKNQVSLTNINRNFPEIISILKNGTSSHTAQSKSAQNERAATEFARSIIGTP